MTGVLPTAVSGKIENVSLEPKMSSSEREKRAFSPTSPSVTTRFSPGKGVPLADMGKKTGVPLADMRKKKGVPLADMGKKTIVVINSLKYLI